jgi:uncharacterized membrane protein required for colicin V production
MRHDADVIQNPEPAVASAETATREVLQQLQSLSWVDHTALVVLLVFFVLGLFKGLIWQVSRVGILVVAYVVSGRFGHEVASWLSPGATLPNSNAPQPGGEAGVNSDLVIGETTLYLAYVALFLVVLIVLSLLAILLQKLAAKAGLGFFDRLGGGVIGVATGGAVVLFGLFVLHMFFRDTKLAIAAEHSHSLRISRQAIDWLGDKVPDALRAVFSLSPLRTPVIEPGPTLPGLPQPELPTPDPAGGERNR